MHCKDCAFAIPDDWYTDMYQCSKIIDANTVYINYNKDPQTVDQTIAYTWDYESFSSGNYVGKDFGCIHFKQKDNHD